MHRMRISFLKKVSLPKKFRFLQSFWVFDCLPTQNIDIACPKALWNLISTVPNLDGNFDIVPLCMSRCHHTACIQSHIMRQKSMIFS